jgi:putative transposase
VLRIMQANKLTLERHTGGRPGRTHDGVVIALRSNIRWSDHFELACRNGEIVRVLFAIDACDREVVAAAVPPDPTDSDLLAALPSEVLYFVVRGRQR